MKLRNKETGKVQTCDMVVITDEKIDGEIASLNKHTFMFRSIEQFNDEYEAYEPREPLIKDEKVRKAVRAWAEANGFNADYYEFNIKTLPAGTRFSVGHYDIEFIGFFIYDLQTENSYTLAELCGENEQ